MAAFSDACTNKPQGVLYNFSGNPQSIEGEDPNLSLHPVSGITSLIAFFLEASVVIHFALEGVGTYYLPIVLNSQISKLSGAMSGLIQILIC